MSVFLHTTCHLVSCRQGCEDSKMGNKHHSEVYSKPASAKFCTRQLEMRTATLKCSWVEACWGGSRSGTNELDDM